MSKETEYLWATELMFLSEAINLFLEPNLDVLVKLDTIENKIEKFRKESEDKIAKGEDFKSNIKKSLFKEFSKEELDRSIPMGKFTRGHRKSLYNLLEKVEEVEKVEKVEEVEEDKK